jgi:predicted dienelactone hydrolase
MKARKLLTTILFALLCGAFNVGCTDEESSNVDNDASDVDADSSDGSDIPEPNEYDFQDRGPFAAGHQRITLSGGDEADDVVAEIWYPATPGTDSDEDLATYVTDEGDLSSFESSLEAADDACTRKQVTSVTEGTPAELDFDSPVLVFSHCLGCTRFSSATIAEYLASFGFVVLSADHAGNTYFDEDPKLSTAALEVRLAEVQVLLETIATPPSTLPEPAKSILAGADSDTLGIYGHSFGSVTAGNIAAGDNDIEAVAGLAAPFNFIGSVTLSELTMPSLFVVLEEDNSISEIGNGLIRSNYEDIGGTSWIFEIPDAGHFSISSLCGIDDGFSACCGEAQRQTDPDETFTYPPAQPIRDQVAQDVSAFFAAQLLGSASAESYLEARVGEREDNLTKPAQE